MLSPMQMRQQAVGGGETAIFSLNPDLIQSSYDPSTPAAFVPAPDGSLTVKGIFARDKKAGQDQRRVGEFAFYSPVEIPGLAADDTFVTLPYGKFLAKEVRLRHWMGKVDGYSMDLMVG